MSLRHKAHPQLERTITSLDLPDVSVVKRCPSYRELLSWRVGVKKWISDIATTHTMTKFNGMSEAYFTTRRLFFEYEDQIFLGEEENPNIDYNIAEFILKFFVFDVLEEFLRLFFSPDREFPLPFADILSVFFKLAHGLSLVARYPLAVKDAPTLFRDRLRARVAAAAQLHKGFAFVAASAFVALVDAPGADLEPFRFFFSCIRKADAQLWEKLSTVVHRRIEHARRTASRVSFADMRIRADAQDALHAALREKLAPPSDFQKTLCRFGLTPARAEDLEEYEAARRLFTSADPQQVTAIFASLPASGTGPAHTTLGLLAQLARAMHLERELAEMLCYSVSLHGSAPLACPARLGLRGLDALADQFWATQAREFWEPRLQPLCMCARVEQVLRRHLAEEQQQHFFHFLARPLTDACWRGLAWALAGAVASAAPEAEALRSEVAALLSAPAAGPLCEPLLQRLDEVLYTAFFFPKNGAHVAETLVGIFGGASGRIQDLVSGVCEFFPEGVQCAGGDGTQIAAPWGACTCAEQKSILIAKLAFYRALRGSQLIEHARIPTRSLLALCGDTRLRGVAGFKRNLSILPYALPTGFTRLGEPRVLLGGGDARCRVGAVTVVGDTPMLIILSFLAGTGGATMEQLEAGTRLALPLLLARVLALRDCRPPLVRVSGGCALAPSTAISLATPVTEPCTVSLRFALQTPLEDFAEIEAAYRAPPATEPGTVELDAAAGRRLEAAIDAAAVFILKQEKKMPFEALLLKVSEEPFIPAALDAAELHDLIKRRVLRLIESMTLERDPRSQRILIFP
eukprot:gnl/Chilomastix_cuspidata/489.p2 GENE.gnl/Chilomastix_cuspidata/489~~gnl/Chilomastix_cuspidata/489.p2  ORF type:complete len:803 (+),score=250.62 gnl/Chilomastix_cuspidata/489:40-2448(+)